MRAMGEKGEDRGHRGKMRTEREWATVLPTLKIEGSQGET